MQVWGQTNISALVEVAYPLLHTLLLHREAFGCTALHVVADSSLQQASHCSQAHVFIRSLWCGLMQAGVWGRAAGTSCSARKDSVHPDCRAELRQTARTKPLSERWHGHHLQSEDDNALPLCSSQPHCCPEGHYE